MARKLLYLNGLAILCVIVFHAAGWGYTAMFSWADRYLPVTVPDYSQLGSPVYVFFRIIDQVVVFSIPAFLFVSGFFIAFSTPKTKPTVAWKTVFTRIKLLAIPYLLWTAFALAVNVLQGRAYTPWEILRSILIGSTFPSYYFIPLLIQLYLVSPILVPLARKHWKILLILTGLLQLSLHAAIYPVELGVHSPFLDFMANGFPKWFLLARLFWFSAGMVVGFHLSEFKPFIVKMRPLWIALTLATLVGGYFEWEWITQLAGGGWLAMRETVVDAFYGGFVILSVLSLLDKKLPLTNTFDDLGGKSFGIYLVHSPTMEYFSRAVYHFAPGILAYQFLFMALVAIVGLGVPLLLMLIGRKTPLQRIYSYAFG
jgi:peptidoglycan/LPS O-acetylase OafA/YrhL